MIFNYYKLESFNDDFVTININLTYIFYELQTDTDIMQGKINAISI